MRGEVRKTEVVPLILVPLGGVQVSGGKWAV